MENTVKDMHLIIPKNNWKAKRTPREWIAHKIKRWWHKKHPCKCSCHQEPVAELTFHKLRTSNICRCINAFHAIDEWTPTDWATAWAGEVGETCNLIKKLRRGEDVSMEDVAFEIADSIIYADLLSARFGISLDEAVITKFNIVSDRVGSKIKIGKHPY